MSAEKLTKNQIDAISNLDQNVAVLAGAGTGKTRVLVERFLSIIERKLAAPSEILAITFTEKAANEMKRRIVDELRSRGLHEARHEIENAYIGTIHAFCSRLLKEHPMEAGIDPDFRVCEEEEADLLKEEVFEQLIEERFRDSSVFSLLSVYGEEMIGKRIKDVYDEIRTFGIFCENAFKSAQPDDSKMLEQDLIDKLSSLLGFEKKKENAEKALACLKSSAVSGWEQIDLLQGIDGWFDLRAREGKDETKAVKEAIARLVASRIEELVIPDRQTFESLLLDFSRRYAAAKHERALFDFSDLETYVLRLLTSGSESSAAVRKRYQKQFKFIMVDEFQDTNSVQVQIIELLKNPKNLFLVGDIKQSIYGFRGALPDLFRKKQKEFEAEKTGISITLLDNFRSRPELLQFINPFFEELWRQSELPYEPLAAGRNFESALESAVDLIAIDKEDNETVSETRSEEARAIAHRIRELVDQEGYRYGDFAVLFRAGESMRLYEQELLRFGIPHYIIGGRGFYHQAEVRDTMNFLTILENPLREIEFAAVLRSPMFRVSDDMLFRLSQKAKTPDKHTPLFEGFKTWKEIQKIPVDERAKLERFESVFGELSVLKGKLRISELLEMIFNQTRYDLYALGLPQGKRHFANLRKLVDLARELEERETVHLGDFIRYVKGLVRHEVRESEAQVEAEEGNVVRLMTVHKAKGLEFRCVIVPDLARKQSHGESQFLYDPELGLGLRALNPFSGDFEDSRTYLEIEDKVAERQARESKRLLYVAMTRAKERLIFAGTAKLSNAIKPDSINWFDWLRVIIHNQKLNIRMISSEVRSSKYQRRRSSLIHSEKIRSNVKNSEPVPMRKVPPEAGLILNQLKAYPAEFFERIDLPVSAYVTFGRDAEHSEFRDVYELGAKSVPAELKSEEELLDEAGETISAADFGTLVHQIFEHLINWKSETAVPLDEWLAFYGADFDDSVKNDARKLVQIFLKSKLFSDIQKAKRTFAELPFVLRLRHGIVQGTLDLIYETANGEYVIVDYKTSEINEANLQEKGESYRDQMELYMLACREILGVMPSKAVLYFVKMDETYDIVATDSDYETLQNKFETLQKQIIEFRKLIRAS